MYFVLSKVHGNLVIHKSNNSEQKVYKSLVHFGFQLKDDKSMFEPKITGVPFGQIYFYTSNIHL